MPATWSRVESLEGTGRLNTLSLPPSLPGHKKRRGKLRLGRLESGVPQDRITEMLQSKAKHQVGSPAPPAGCRESSIRFCCLVVLGVCKSSCPHKAEVEGEQQLGEDRWEGTG